VARGSGPLLFKPLPLLFVMPGLVPGIHGTVLKATNLTWVAGTSPAAMGVKNAPASKQSRCCDPTRKSVKSLRAGALEPQRRSTDTNKVAASMNAINCHGSNGKPFFFNHSSSLITLSMAHHAHRSGIAGG